MDLPAYVPDAARRHAAHFLGHYEPLLKESEAELAKIEEAIAARMQRGETEYLDGLRQRRAEATKRRDRLASDIATILRLVQDARMKDAYRILTGEFFADEEREQTRKLDGFIYAAWAAGLDFAPYRKRLKRAAALRNEIAKIAAKLAGLLRQIGDTGVDCPAEFFNIPELLRQTDNLEWNGHDFHIWRAMRGTVLGDPPRQSTPDDQPEPKSGDAADASPPNVVISFLKPSEAPKIDPVEEMRNTLRYGWGKAPPMRALLATVADVARQFTPGESGFIGAAISSRKQNPKTEYLRAFADLLTDEHRFILTTPIMQAIAIAASVVINDPDFDVTYDDVRKTWTRLSGKALEDSGEK